MKDIESNYIKEFSAIVTKAKKDYICLDKTALYPTGGGQPSDSGIIIWNNKESKIMEVIKKGDTIKHIISGEKPPIGTKVKVKLDWQRRYSHMKMHTAQHIISGIIFDEYNARTVGNQIHSDYSRVDFKPANFTDNDIKNIKIKFNEIISKNLPIKIYQEERVSLEKRVDQQRANLDLLPKFVKNLRIIEIKDFDICPCAGTHVRNTSEISKISSIKKESKGADTTRIIYSF
jgi:misacylated tRNA(Ala) deacylase